jgi:hypothetical protein
MRKFLIASLSVAAVFYFFLTEVSEPVGDISRTAAVVQPETGPGTTLASPDDPAIPALLYTPSSAAPGGKTLAPSGKYSGPAPAGLEAATAADPDERTAALRYLADHNIAQLYQVLWQELEVEGPEDAAFREFILAAIGELGDSAPGEVLAALVLTAPTSELRLSALRLITEASQELAVDPFNQALEDPDPSVRRSALSFFEEMGADALLDAVAGAVLDSDQTVRLLAFSTLEEMYEFAPVWKVADSVIDDPDPQIRMRGLELLTFGDRQAAIERLVVALGDPDSGVNELARALLTELEQDPS